jgi:HK97 family phage major capsid protein
VAIYNSLTSRTDSQSLMPEEVSNELLRTVTTNSAVMQRFRHIPVARAQVRFPILSALPVAYWVNGDTGLKQTTEINWSNKYLNIEEIAVIVPIPDNVLADVAVNVWDEAMPYLSEAVGITLDTAVLFGTNAPSSFPTNVVAAAAAAANTVTEGTVAASGGYMADIDLAYGKVESDGFEPNGVIAATSLKGKLRAARNSLGDRLDVGRIGVGLNEIDGYPISYPMRGQWATGSGSARALVGDWDQFVIGIRQDITVDMSNEAVIQDNTGNIVYNAYQQDLTFLRLKMRAGWQVANLINRDQPVEANRYPVASLLIP